MSSDDFKKMLEESFDASDDMKIGQVMEGTIVSISGDEIFVDINDKSDAVIDAGEITTPEGNSRFAVGDKIKAMVLSSGGGTVKLTTMIGRSQISKKLAGIAYRQELPVEGIVSSVRKGGFSVSVGGVNCFCPMSQMDIKRISNPEAFTGKSFTFSVQEFSEGGRNIVLSRREYLEELRAERQEKLRQEIAIGDEISGRIISTHSFGIFMDLDGIEALIPKSEISWSRNDNPDNYKEGNIIKARIIDLDWEKGKITASARALQKDPWEKISGYSAGDKVTGRVVNLIRQGAFVELEPGLEGFIHVSRLSLTKRVNNPSDILSTGDPVEVKILDINPEEKRISLELITDEENPWNASDNELTDRIHEAEIEAVFSKGLRIRLSNGLEGFVPTGELKNSKSDPDQNYDRGSVIKVCVKDLNRDERSCIFSERQALRMQEQQEFKKFMNSQDEQGPSTLGNLFKDKFVELQNKVDK